MRSYVPFVSLIALLLLLLNPGFALSQKKSGEDLIELPKIVVRGEDRSYLQIKRPTQIYYMSYKGVKGKSEVPKVKLIPPREVEVELLFPSVVKIGKIELSPPVKEIKISGPLIRAPSLSKKYMLARQVSLPQQRGQEKIYPLQKKGIKKLIRPPVQPPLLARKTYLPAAGPFVGVKKASLIKVEERGKVPASSPAPFTLSQNYIKEERISLLEEQKKEKAFPQLQALPKKETIPAYPLVKVPEKYVASTTPPPLVSTAAPVKPYIYEREVSPPSLPQVSLGKTYVEPRLRPAQKEKELAVVKEIKEEKMLIRPPLFGPSVKRLHFPKKVEKAEYPFLIFSLSSDDAGGFGYQLRYAREREKRRYVLNLKRELFPEYVTYQEKILSKGMDTIEGGIGWGEVGKNDTTLFVQGKKKTLTLPDSGERKDTNIYFSGETFIFENWRIGLQAEKSTREDATPEEKYENFGYGVNLALQPQESDFLLEGKLNWSNVSKLTAPEDTKTNSEALLQIRSPRAFSIGKNLFLESTRVGVKGIQNQEAQLVGSLNLRWYEKKSLGVYLSVDKKFYLPSFSEVYIPRDYSRVRMNLGAVNMTRYALEVNYSQFPPIDASVTLFSEKGDDLVWRKEKASDFLEPQIMRLSREGVTLKGNWQLARKVTLEPSFTWQKVRNEQTPGGAVPYQPENLLEAVLTIDILNREEDRLAFIAKGEWLSKRFSTESADVAIEPSSRAELKLTYQRKTWGVFVGMEKNNYFLSPDYKLLENKLKFGAEIKLF